MDQVEPTQSRKPNPAAQARFVLIMGYWMLMIAFAGAHITLAGQYYGGTLRTSLILALLSAPCLIFAFSRERNVTRVFALLGGVFVLLTLGQTVRRLF